MSINISEMIITIVNFLLLMLLLKIILYTPLMKVMDARRAVVREGLQAGEQARQALKDSDRIMLERLQDSGEEAKQLLSRAKAAAARDKAQILRDANEKAVRIRAESVKRIAEERIGAVKRVDDERDMLLNTLTRKLTADAAAEG